MGRRLKRGEIWTAVGTGEYAGKPRPVVVIQDDRFDATASVTVCPFTSAEVEAPLLRLQVEPDAGNGLAVASRLMVDKVVTVPRERMGKRVGRLSQADIVRLDRSLLTFLGLAG